MGFCAECTTESLCALLAVALATHGKFRPLQEVDGGDMGLSGKRQGLGSTGPGENVEKKVNIRLKVRRLDNSREQAVNEL